MMWLRSTPQDVLIEERDWNQTNTSYSGSEIYEWNLDGLTDRQLTILVHRMLMYATICKSVNNTDRTIFKMIIAAPNCKLEKLKSLELAEEVHDKIFSFLYTFGSEFDYDSDSGSEKDDVNNYESSNARQPTANVVTNACKCNGEICSCEDDEFFYKLQSQFEDLNIDTITFDNVIKLLKEVTNNNLRDKIIQLAINNNNASSSKPIENLKKDFEFEYSAPYSLSEVNTRLHVQPVVIRDASFDDLKGEIENLKNEIKSLKKNQMICDHGITQLETISSKGKNIVDDNIVDNKTTFVNDIVAKPINHDPKKDMFLGMTQIVTAHK
ncbi:hypothetical protein H5410_057512 [Solanum commersonii]|uniref:DUF7746 domain-containing protein n=1 Tax=Solanum commersonii TaxID=4109 RepID=A0A9J5WP85_SOLCO|nr:hypothetical protein H5410_057512 [Solanum commersonii]